MIKPGDIVTKVEVTKTDNTGDDTGQEGYDIFITFNNGREGVGYSEYDDIDELEDQPNGVYEFDGKEYKQIENWE